MARGGGAVQAVEAGVRAPLPADPSACPPLPEAARDALLAGLAALAPDAAVGPERVVALEGHLRLLLAWTESINLTGVREPVAAVVGHVLDSLAALPLLRAAGVDVLLDLGSGGGYPGLALAAALPARHALLVDSIAKKIRFLDTAIAALGLGDTIGTAAVRAEDLATDPRHREAWQAVTVRAVGALSELVEIAFPLLAPGGLLVAWKRHDIDDERRRALPAIAALGGGRLDVHSLPAGLRGAPELAAHRLVVVTKTGRTPGQWPRPPAERRRQPW
jgi:16S rRNA (guanine527-N7)-methyltransferase